MARRLDPDEQQVRAALLDAQRLAATRRMHRAELISRTGVVERLDADLVLLDRATDDELHRELTILDERLAILRHCRPDAPGVTEQLASSRELRTRVANHLAGARRRVQVELGPVEPAGSSAGRRLRLRASTPERRLRDLLAELRSAAGALVLDIVDADVLRLDVPRARDRPPLFRCADDSSETRARVTAFADEVDRLAEVREAAVERGLFEALERTAGSEALEVRRARDRALASIDALRAMQAAVAELEALDPPGGFSADRPDP